MTSRLDYFKGLPRRDLQSEIRALLKNEDFYLWEYMNVGWFYIPLRADDKIATLLGVRVDEVVGYIVLAGHVLGGGFFDQIGVPKNLPPSHPDPFKWAV